MPARLCCILALLLAAAPAAAAPPAAIVDAAVEKVIRPGYDVFADSAAALASSTRALCTEPSFPALEAAHSAFSDALLAWARIEFVQFGPVRQDNRLERVMFVQDRKGIALRQIQAMLAARDPADLVPGALYGKSVAVQGFPALEFVLYGADAEQLAFGTAAYRCALGAAIAANIETIAGTLAQEWRNPRGITALLGQPGPDNPLYRDEGEALSAILEILPDGYELIVETRLQPFIGESPAEANPKRALFWRSGHTRSLLKGNLEGLAALAERSGALEGLSGESAALAGNLPLESRRAIDALDALGEAPPRAAETAEGHGRLAYLVVLCRSLRDVSRRGVLGAYGLSAGFSSLDGD